MWRNSELGYNWRTATSEGKVCAFVQLWLISYIDYTDVLRA